MNNMLANDSSTDCNSVADGSVSDDEDTDSSDSRGENQTNA